MVSKFDFLMLSSCPFFLAVEAGMLELESYILRPSNTHSTWPNLYQYKALLLIQKKLNSGKERNIDTFIAGLIGGYIVFGDRNAVNEQIVLYVISRVLASLLPRANQVYSVSSGSARSTSTVQPIPPDSRYFSIFAAFSWGAVMYLFRNRGETIQPGMFNSMVYLYRDSETWSDLRTLLWHNT